MNYLGQWLAHLSIALFILGAVYTEQFDRDYNIEFNKSSETKYNINKKLSVSLVDIKNISFKNHDQIKVLIKIDNLNNSIELSPSKNIYKPSGQITTEVSKSNYLFDHFYSTITSINEDRIILNIVYKPMINLLWLATILLIIGIGMSMLRKKNYE
jgi:cytochrome c-type biogenesis protein CcmF